MAEETRTLYCARCLTTFTSNGDACPNLGCGKPRPPEGWGRMHQPGDVFDRNYIVNKTLALGGAGVTYLCREIDQDDAEVGPRIALKVLFATRDHGSYLQRLATEAQILRQLDHPNIVQYLGFVHRAGHSPYLLTRFEEGGSLLDHMRRVGTMPIKIAASVGRQVCWALEKAHDKGIIHRDLKPENMLMSEVVDKEGHPTVRVADFGIAKVQGSLGTGLTRIGSFVGTPQYAAPEQFIGETATPATDVYSLGAVLVFLMTARPVVKNAHRMEPEEVYLLLKDKLPPTVQRPKDPEIDSVRMNAVLGAAMQFETRERCGVKALDRMLEAIVDDRDPDVPERVVSAVPVLEESVEEPPVQLLSLPPVSEPPRGPVSAGTETRSDDAVEEETRENQEPSAPPDPPIEAPVPALEAPPPRRRSRDEGSIFGWLLGSAGLVVLLVVLAGAGIGAWWYLSQTPETAVVEATGGGARRKARSGPVRDLRSDRNASSREMADLLGRRLGRRSARVWSKHCTGKGGEMHIDITVESDGTVRRARPVGGGAPKSHWCLTKNLVGKRIAWNGDQAMRFRWKGRL
jgi:serine/threonine protein kinase